MENQILLVDDEPYCVWDPGLKERVKQFLDSFDSGFFTHMAISQLDHLTGDDRRRAATATRFAYLHGLETLMTLFGATVQATHIPYAWIMLCSTGQLRSVVRKIDEGDRSLWHNLRGFEHTWESLARLVLQFAPDEAGWKTDTVEDFSKAWSAMAQDFLEPAYQQEYNALKHGLRVHPGGFQLSFARESSPGAEPPPGSAVSLGGSEFGTSFLTIEKAGHDVTGNRSRRTRKVSVNWNPETLVKGLQIIDISIGNLLSFLKVIHGAQPSSTPFQRTSRDDFVQARTHNVGVKIFRMDSIYPDELVPTADKESLLELLHRKTVKSSAGEP